MAAMNWLRENLRQVFCLPDDSIDWLLMLYQAIQLFDDVADGDKIERVELDAVIWNSLVGFHQNAFFLKNSHHLLPVIATSILKWQASDRAERNGAVDQKSFMWRASYYDVVMAVVLIHHGPAIAAQLSDSVMHLYGEKYEDYIKEFSHA